MLAVATLVASCALNRSGSKLPVVKTCVLPEDQVNTLSGKWRITPIPLALHEGSNFAAPERTLISNAVNTWNSFYAESLGLQPIELVADSTAPRPSNPCQPIVNGNSFTGPIVIYKMGVWPVSNGGPGVIALTTTCPNPGGNIPTFFGSIMELNYQHYFIDGRKLPDLQTIVLHELGHVLGLNHSCSTNGDVNFPGCSDFGVSTSYAKAVMAPTFGFDSQGFGEQKRALTSNDQGRANCLYEPGS